MANNWRKKWKQWQTIFLGSKTTADNDCRHEIKTFAHWKESYDKSRQRIKKQRHHFATKAPLVKAMVFSSSRVQMWEWDHKEGWAPKNWCSSSVVLEKTSESPLDSKEIKPVNPKGSQPKYPLEGLMLKLNPQYFDYLMQRANSLEKTLLLGKIEGKRRRG